jgi:hypothetical protein
MAASSVELDSDDLSLQTFSVAELREGLRDAQNDTEIWGRAYLIKVGSPSENADDLVFCATLVRSHITVTKEYRDELLRRGRKVRPWPTYSWLAGLAEWSEAMIKAAAEDREAERQLRMEFTAADSIRALSFGVRL